MSVFESSLNQQSMSWWETFCKKALLKVLNRVQNAHIVFTDHEEQISLGNEHAEIQAEIEILNPAAYGKFLFSGSIGAGESYIAGDWQSQDLTSVIKAFARCQKELDHVEAKFAWLSVFKDKLLHRRNKNSLTGSKNNILAHYDLGNDLYTAFLDRKMQYSSAIYPENDSTLEVAQINKLQVICDRLDLQESDHLIEIGTGWGGLAIFAAQHFGCRVTSTTISDAQYEYACEQVKRAKLEDKVTLLKKDYRLLEGKYDKLVSIEMIEAVGHEYIPGFFEKCNSLLKSDGKMLIQAITIADQRYEHYRTNVDFIQKHIFPGGCLPSIKIMSEMITKKTDLVVEQLHDIGLHYAKTIADWRERFNSAWPELNQSVYDQEFSRLWNFYLCYCEGAFIERSTSTVHLVARKPDYKSNAEKTFLDY